MPKDKFQAFERAMRDLQIEQWLMAQKARRWRTSDAEDIREFAERAKIAGRLFEQLLADAGALVGAEAGIEGIDDIVTEFAGELRAQAQKLDDDERERFEHPPVWSAKLDEFV